MNILILEPYFTGSHAAWAVGYQKYSSHQVDILSLKGQFWKWRMHGGAVTLARMFDARSDKPDILLATDMLDLTTFLALTTAKALALPTALYFHENQFAYPWSPDDRDVSHNRDKHYGFINYASALAADRCFFNSRYNFDTFMTALPAFLQHFPDYNELSTIDHIKSKSMVLPLGLDLRRFDDHYVEKKNNPPIILWNHRWEHDKNPKEFFKAMDAVDDAGYDFRLVLLGENFRHVPQEFERAHKRFKRRILHYGYATKFADYAQWLWRADILPVTSLHDFFGISVVEAMYCGCYPLLPKRLAYPELLPDNQEHHFYHDAAQLVEMLKSVLQQREETDVLKSAVARFDWQQMAPLYDREFEHMLQR